MELIEIDFLNVTDIVITCMAPVLTVSSYTGSKPSHRVDGY